MAGNTVYVQGNYVDVHDNEVVNLSIAQVPNENLPSAYLCTIAAGILALIACMSASLLRIAILSEMLNEPFSSFDWKTSVPSSVRSPLLYS